jgi:hypothetical protein
MRPLLLTALCLFAGLSASALAGSDSNEAPNPFTDQPATGSGLTSVGNGPNAPSQDTAVIAPQGSDYSALPGAQSSALPSSGGDFYQAAKKDNEGR